MITEIFVMFSALWWVLGGLTFFALVWAVAHEETSGRLSSLVFGIYVGLLVLFGDFQPWVWVTADPLNFVWKTGAYLGIGFVWSCVYWWIRCLNKRKEYNNDLKDWLIERGIPEDSIGSVPDPPADLRQAWTSQCKMSSAYGKTIKVAVEGGRTTKTNVVEIIPRIRDNKAEFTVAWLAWPASMFWSLFDDMLRAVGHAIYDWFGGILQAFANSAFRGTESHFEEEASDVSANVPEPKDEHGSKHEWSKKD